MAMEAIINPAQPSVWDINGMFVGKSISVYGVLDDNPESIRVNFWANDDIALHFNPRFSENQVVRNTLLSGNWGKEERQGGFPFVAGKPFFIEFICKSNGFNVRANSYKTFTKYEHRVPLTSLNKVEVKLDGKVKVVSSAIDGLEAITQRIVSPTASVEVPFFNIKTHSLIMVGKPTSSDGRFHLNFLDGNKQKIYLHFNPRMNQSMIVRNTRSEGEKWGEEERDLKIPFPFVQGVPFQLRFYVEKKQFRVELNGSNLLSYDHRMKHLKAIKYVDFAGDVEVEKFEFI